MDPTLVLAPLLNALWWLIPLALLGALLKSSRVKGSVGEHLVRWALRLRLDRATYRAVHDLTLPTPDGTTQIDLVLRTVKKGPRAGDRFRGCSTYPQCRVMQPLG